MSNGCASLNCPECARRAIRRARARARAGGFWQFGFSSQPVSVSDYASSLSLTGFWRDATAAPWTGKKSSGASLGRNLNAGTPTPTVGSPVQAHNAHVAGQFVSAANMSTFISTTAYSGWVLMKTGTTGPTFLSVQGSHAPDFSITWVSGTSVRLTSWGDDGAGHAALAQATTPITSGVYQYVQFRAQIAGLAAIKVNTGSWVTATQNAGTTFTTMGTSPLAFGDSLFDGGILDVGITNTVLTDPDFALVRTYLRQRYALATI